MDSESLTSNAPSASTTAKVSLQNCQVALPIRGSRLPFRSTELIDPDHDYDGIYHGSCRHGFLVISPMFATVSPFFIEGTAQM